MTWKATEICDCNTIQKAFERGANFAVTEESVFAMMTPNLNAMRSISGSFVNQVEANEAIENPALGVGAQGVGVKNIDKADEDDERFFEKIAGNFFPGSSTDPANDFLGNIFNSECIPCGFRKDTYGQIVLNIADGLSGWANNMMEYYRTWFLNMLQQIRDLLDIFSGMNKYVDLCALINFFKEFVCVPDLQRLVALLMALMLKMSFDLNFIVDLIIGLIAPLLMPFLSALVDQLQKYLLMIIEPLECIVEAISEIMRKLDYNVFFENIDKLDTLFSVDVNFGPKVGPWKEDPRGPIKVPFIDYSIPRGDISESDERAFSGDAKVANPAASEIRRIKLEEDKKVQQAAAELARLEASKSQVDGSNPREVERYKEQRETARENYNNAVEERDLSEIGQARKAIDSTMKNLKSALLTLIDLIREAAREIEAFVRELFEEFKKLMGEWLGTAGQLSFLLNGKMTIVQMIGFIVAIIKALTGNLNCDGDEEDLKLENFLPQHSDYIIYTDNDGNLHINEDETKTKKAFEDAVKAIGLKATGSRGPNSVPEAIELSENRDKGNLASEEDPRQKLKSLVEFTGDPVVDTQIARVTETLTTPINVVFKCPLQTSVEDADQINKWIEELDK